MCVYIYIYDFFRFLFEVPAADVPGEQQLLAQAFI